MPLVWRPSDKFIGLIALISSWVCNLPQTNMFRGHFSQSQCAFWIMLGYQRLICKFSTSEKITLKWWKGTVTWHILDSNMSYGKFTSTRLILTLDIFCFTWNPFSHRHRNDWCWPIYLNNSLKTGSFFSLPISLESCITMVMCG